MVMRMDFMPVIMAAVMLLAGCADTAPKRGPSKRAMGIPPRADYPALEGYHLTLRHTGSRVLRCGEGGRITFALRNAGRDSLRVLEWYSNEPDNLIVSCQPWLTGMEGPDESAWTELSFDVRMPPIRYPLELMPGNQVLVTKELPFVDKLAISPGAERRFFIRAKLNLKSVSAESPVSVIVVRPGGKEAGAGSRRKR